MDIKKIIDKAQEINIDLTSREYTKRQNIKEKIIHLAIRRQEIEKELNYLIFKYKKGEKINVFKTKKTNK